MNHGILDVLQAHQQAGVDPSAGADFGAGASGRWPAGQEQSGMSIGGVPEQAAPPTGSQTGKHPASDVAPSQLSLLRFGWMYLFNFS